MNKLIRMMIWMACSFIGIQNCTASNYKFCMKWALGAIGVECQSKFNVESPGSILLFKKIAAHAWQYHSAYEKYPFEIILEGPGLEGPTVTPYGQIACEQFCMKYTHNIL